MSTTASRRSAVAGDRESTVKKAESKSQPVACSHSVTRRLQLDLTMLMTFPVKGISAFPSGDNLFHWNATIVGVADTPYENLTYKLSLEFTDKYPCEAPRVKFTSPCFHPNVDDKGNICLDILKEQWAPSYEVKTILISIQSLLGEPNNESPLNTYAASLWDNQEEFKAVVARKYEKDVRQKLKE
ncbi:probable ubiquitin-conjugating enzyme E2 C [Rhopilema esculentum]|uniref:probable ubiquitin-conjugating enzyme E2 C n=1 Tax=Rhopilema esculentum TaxID=499914 RepID=UPI0031CE403B